jgi:hypothetical protein
MQRLLITAAAALSLAAFAGCSNDPTVNNNNNGTGGVTSNPTFIQVAREGRPGVKELYLPYAAHDAFNRDVPTNDIAKTAPQIDAFVTGTAGRSAGISAYTQALLAPDALVANLADTSTRASYLGWETGGQIAVDCTGLPGTTFGGRALDDDVVNAMLGLAFGNLATSATLTVATPNVSAAIPADDGKEKNGQNGTPNLTNQLASCSGKGFTPNQFPYLANPI